MADPNNQVLTQEPAGAEAAYRPISGLAIAGLTLACVYVLVVAVSTGAALIQGAGFFLPNALFLVPLAGAVLCLLAQRQIRGSEGTRAGLALARWGLWLSVFTGVGYFSYYYFTYLAIRSQANAFLMEKDVDSGFFPLLKEGGPVQVNAAFLLTQPENSRGNIKPDNMAQMIRRFDAPNRQGVGELTMFRERYLVKALQRAGSECRIEPQGVHDWGYEKGGYKVARQYRITTPEAVIKTLVTVRSTEGEEGSMRKWFVVMQQLGTRVEYTPLGEALKNLEVSARDFMQARLEEHHQGKSTEAIPDKTNWEQVAQGPGPEVRDLIRAIIKGKNPNHMFNVGKEEYLSPWRIEKGKAQFDFFGRIQFAGPMNKPMTADCKITVECKERVVPPGQTEPNPAQFPPQPHWQMESFVVERLGFMSFK